VRWPGVESRLRQAGRPARSRARGPAGRTDRTLFGKQKKKKKKKKKKKNRRERGGAERGGAN